ncbi:hypothetical protein N0B44_06600 [Roseibacterium beibuensis]|uniref:hypothetical protein n=1 Tax=[Roseibacterium] beibuensis TaxID=1193142 RepID=UPI00217F1B98|nr:hypothetical protein [Roseibacterium beibuensis]MCS6622572.1 hypothetical protein [Roseibacterium beibuensis]
MTEAPPKSAARGFRPGVILALILAAVFSLSAIGVLAAYAPELDRGDDGRDHALSRSAIGYGGLVSLLREMKRPILLSRGSLGGGAADSLVVLTPPLGREEEGLDRLLYGPSDVLVVLPKWDAQGDPTRAGWVRGLRELEPGNSLSVLPEHLRIGLALNRREGAAPVRLEGARNRRIADGAEVERLRTLSGEGWTPIIVDGRGEALVAVHEDSGVMVLADPDLINTRGMNDPRKARAAVALLDELGATGGGVVFDLSLAGFSRPRSVLRLMLEPPLLGFSLCLAFAVGLIGWQAAIRFAPHGHARRAVALGKKALADNTAALVRLARREHRMAAPYARLVRAQAARAVAAPPRLSEAALTAMLDRLAARKGATTPYDALAAEADKARTASDLMAVARALNRWKLEMTRGHE